MRLTAGRLTAGRLTAGRFGTRHLPAGRAGTSRAQLRRSAVALLAALATSGALAACSNGSDSAAPTSATPTTTATVIETASPAPATTEETTTTASSTTSAAPVSGPTQVSTLRPFARGGGAAAGWTIDGDDAGVAQIDCTAAQPSPSAVDDGILYCTPAAAAADTCYVAPRTNDALCLVDPFSRRVAHYTTKPNSDYNVDHPMDPQPLGLQLDDGTQCRLRNGGAWTRQSQHPDYVGYYTCGSGSSSSAVWAAPNSQTAGIDTSSNTWTVQVGTSDGALQQHTVSEAYLVGISND